MWYIWINSPRLKSSCSNLANYYGEGQRWVPYKGLSRAETGNMSRPHTPKSWKTCIWSVNSLNRSKAHVLVLVESSCFSLGISLFSPLESMLRGNPPIADPKQPNRSTTFHQGFSGWFRLCHLMSLGHASQIWLNTTLRCRWIIPIWANNHPNMTSIWIHEMGDTVPTHPPFRTIQGEPCLPIFQCRK